MIPIPNITAPCLTFTTDPPFFGFCLTFYITFLTLQCGGEPDSEDEDEPKKGKQVVAKENPLNKGSLKGSAKGSAKGKKEESEEEEEESEEEEEESEEEEPSKRGKGAVKGKRKKKEESEEEEEES